MCETTYDPHKPMGEQLEQIIHNISTWRDAVDLIDAQIGSDANHWEGARIALHEAGGQLKLARENTLRAFRWLQVEQREGTHA